MKKVIIYTDGACSGNPGPGGWAALLFYKSSNKELSGYDAQTTNNQMELTAAIEGLKALKERCSVDLYTDSKYVSQGITEWMPKWLNNNWKGSKKKPIKNLELWQALHQLNQDHNVTYHWVKGHADNPYNNRCDELARLEIIKHQEV